MTLEQKIQVLIVQLESLVWKHAKNQTYELEFGQEYAKVFFSNYCKGFHAVPQCSSKHRGLMCCCRNRKNKMP